MRIEPRITRMDANKAFNYWGFDVDKHGRRGVRFLRMVNKEMKQIDTLFKRMDAWRHFPNYQLERRADIFFSLRFATALCEWAEIQAGERTLIAK